MYVVSRRYILRENQRETEERNTVLKLTKERRLVLCMTLREKRKGEFFFAQNTQGR